MNLKNNINKLGSSVLVAAWRRVKAPVGYSLFVIAVGYGLWHAPSQLWEVRPVWLILSIAVIVVMFALQQWQLVLFLKSHHVQPGWLLPALFNARKGILNTVFPARTGTLVMLRSLILHYDVKWSHFLHFFLLAALLSIYISVLAVIWLLWPWEYSISILVVSLVVSYYVAHHSRFIYAACLPSLMLTAFGLYVSAVAVFFCLIRGLGYELSIIEISHFAVVLNVLAQVAITPGNIGVREVMMGLISPYVSLPVSVGIIASSVLLVLRLAVYGVIWAFLEWMIQRRKLASPES